jgi:hypothetical protein
MSEFVFIYEFLSKCHQFASNLNQQYNFKHVLTQNKFKLTVQSQLVPTQNKFESTIQCHHFLYQNEFKSTIQSQHVLTQNNFKSTIQL